METKRAQPCRSAGVERLGELPGEHGGGSDVARLAHAHHIVERLERFLDRRLVIPAVGLVQVEIVDAQAFEAGIDRTEDVLARKPALVGLSPHRHVDLAGDHHLVAAGEIAQGAPQDFFAGAGGVEVGGIEEVDPQFEGAADEWAAGFFIQRPLPALGGAPVAHAPQADARDFEAGVAKAGVLHGFAPVSWMIAKGDILIITIFQVQRIIWSLKRMNSCDFLVHQEFMMCWEKH